MITSLTVAALLSFIAVVGVVVSIGLLVRDLKGSDKDLDRRLGFEWRGENRGLAGPGTQDRGGRIDRTFRDLIEGSGLDMDEQTALMVVAAFAVIGCAAPLLLLENLLAGAAGLLVGAALPLCWWSFCRARRLRTMQNNLPETLDLLSDSMRAGQTLEQASSLVARSVPAPLNEEFGHCVSQLKLGHSPVAVMERMARRIPLPEFRIFTTAVVVHQQTGGNLSLLAHRLAGSARDRQEFDGHVKAVTVASRFSAIGLIVATVVALILLALLRPDYLEGFFNHELGPPLMITAASLQVLGIFWIWRTVKVRF